MSDSPRVESWFSFVAHGVAFHSRSGEMRVAILHSFRRCSRKVIDNVPPIQLSSVAKVKKLLILLDRYLI